MSLADAIQSLADLIFMPYVVAVLLGVGVFLTVRLGFVQVRRFVEAARTMLAQPSQGATTADPAERRGG